MYFLVMLQFFPVHSASGRFLFTSSLPLSLSLSLSLFLSFSLSSFFFSLCLSLPLPLPSHSLSFRLPQPLPLWRGSFTETPCFAPTSWTHCSPTLTRAL